MKIVIIGGGFAGVNLANGLAGNRHIEVLLVDKNNYHLFPPLLYQVATSFIEASNISYPFRKMLQHKKNVRYYQGTLQEIQTDKQLVLTTHGVISYDVLVLAMGTETNYFGSESLKKNSMPMKTVNDAHNLRNHMLINMERAARENSEVQRTKLMNLVIAGGGPTGVELAGMIAEMGRHILKKDYPELETVAGNIYLVSPGKALLGGMSVKARTEAYEQLSRLGVQVKFGVAVKEYQDEQVFLDNGEIIECSTLIWAAGVVACAVPGLEPGLFGHGRRILVDEYNKVKDINNVYAIGDICLNTTDPAYPDGHPQLAQVAIQQGNLLAKNLAGSIVNNKMQPFAYFNKGSMAIISKYKAVVDLPKVSFTGYFAWVTWLFIHILPLAGFRNKLKLFFNWTWSFLTNDPNLRLIFKAESRTVSKTDDL
ncbi:NAD(P)/FAD-dependent oxidoreductase [Mucilaginibacter polytrichastri]|uniref:NADH:ubiquinone reductase (non-electrogenic) n=1 Tax=Mucilaginibacter polytrichastri TaxID=1302689 RepID=A0A1Q5ZW79_9SPHI|nr:NAD(P)/FAD-dependent oxidoreductase [Mucilaginibacter polytrichastri]OKS86031.1 hypothetical protein RG47T_1478 [Mucilaginibacter polytrichastri]SFS59517.1 NADH dehydrogenase [Mucilaginibacter polytrichastri]